MKRWFPAFCVCTFLGQCVLGSGGRGLEGMTTPRKDDVGKSWAVLIGVGEYEAKPGITSLRFTVADARALAEVLVESGGFTRDNVALFVDDARVPTRRPSRSNIIAGLTSWLELTEEPDTVVVYFAGHGIEADNTTYLLPSDARMSNLRLTGIRLSYFLDVLRACNAKRKALILDACHSGAGRDAAQMGTTFNREFDESRGLVVLASCGLGQQSYEWESKGRGVFSFFLTEGLSGAADRDGDACVTSSELSRYVWERTRRWAAVRQLKQTPKFQAEGVEGDLAFVALRKDQPAASEDVGNGSSPPVPVGRDWGVVAGLVLMALVVLAVIVAIWAATRRRVPEVTPRAQPRDDKPKKPPAEAVMPRPAPYTATITRDNPTCFLFLVDQSGSMQDPFGGEEKHKDRGVADAINRLLQDLTIRCKRSDGVRDYFEVGLLGYGGAVGSAFTGALAGRELVPISDIDKNPARVDERTEPVRDEIGGHVESKRRVPIWLDPVARGGTPMCQALGLVEGIIKRWIAQHPDSYPPTVMHITDGEFTDGDPLEAARALMELATSNGNVLLFNCHLSSTEPPEGGSEILFCGPDKELPDDYARKLFEMSSVLPEPIREEAGREGFKVTAKSRGYAFNASLKHFVKWLDIGSGRTNMS